MSQKIVNSKVTRVTDKDKRADKWTEWSISRCNRKIFFRLLFFSLVIVRPDFSSISAKSAFWCQASRLVEHSNCKFCWTRSVYKNRLIRQTHCFLVIDFHIHEVKNEDSLSRQFCSPVLDRNKIIKSSAYNGEFSFAPLGKTKGSDNVFSNAKGRTLI